MSRQVAVGNHLPPNIEDQALVDYFESVRERNARQKQDPPIAAPLP
jgi:hypothetical protein